MLFVPNLYMACLYGMMKLMTNENEFLGTITKSGDYGEKRKTSFHPKKEEASTIRTIILSEGGELLVFHEKRK